MGLKELKQSIEAREVNNDLIIFVGKDYFIAEQYIKEISKQHNREVKSIEDLSVLYAERNGLFYNDDDYLYVCRCKDLADIDINNSSNLIVMTNTVSDNIKSQYAKYVYELPTLEEWQLKDLLYSTCNGADTTDLDTVFNLIKTTKDYQYRLQSEIDKISIFDKSDRRSALKSCIEDGMYDDLSSKTIFDLSNAIIQKNFSQIVDILKEIDKIDIEPLALVSILKKKFTDVIFVQLSKQPTPETTGLKSNQIYAISKSSIGYYNKNQLVDIMLYLTNINKQLVTGQIIEDKFLDMIITKILSC